MKRDYRKNPILQEEKYNSPFAKDQSYNLIMRPTFDPVRTLILEESVRQGSKLAEWSRKLGHNDAYLHQFIYKESPRKLHEDDRKKLAQLMGVPEMSLFPLRRQVVPVGQEFGPHEEAEALPAPIDTKPFPDAIAQMSRIGSGSTTEVVTIEVGEMKTSEPVEDWWRIPPAVLRGLLGANSRSVVGFPVEGDSMEPTIQRTDIVFVDTRRRSIKTDGIWALDYGFGRTLKRVSIKRTEGGFRYVLKSDNKAYPDQEYAPEEVTIFGRYVGRFSVF